MSKETPTKPITPEPQEPFIFHVGFVFVMAPLVGASLALSFAMRADDKTQALWIAIGMGAWVVFWVLATAIAFIRTAIYAGRMKLSGWAEWNEWEASRAFRTHQVVYEMFPLKGDEPDD